MWPDRAYRSFTFHSSAIAAAIATIDSSFMFLGPIKFQPLIFI